MLQPFDPLVSVCKQGHSGKQLPHICLLEVSHHACLNSILFADSFSLRTVEGDHAISHTNPRNGICCFSWYCLPKHRLHVCVTCG
jgi:hypothetical protein